MSEMAEAEFGRLCTVVKESMGLDLQHYRTRQLERRLNTFLQRQRIESVTDLSVRLRADEALRKQFADYLTINVTEFFRNPDRFTELQQHHLPQLLAHGGPLRIWSAGCSIGAEIYSVAMLLAAQAVTRRIELLATDIDELSLQRAASGEYLPGEVRQIPPEFARHLQQTPAGLQLSPTIKQMVKFRRLDLLNDPFPIGQDLVICRNVVIYFTEEAKLQLYRRFHASLRPGGLLFIGGTESIHQAREIGFRYLSPCFYERLEPAGRPN